MDPVTLLLVPGFVGGLFVAFWLACGHRRSTGAGEAPARRADEPITDAINIAHIPVAGVGGLGFLVIALLVAAFVPSIGASLATGAVLGTILAVGLIFWRRHTGPMQSSGRRPGANTTLSIETMDSHPRRSPEREDELGKRFADNAGNDAGQDDPGSLPRSMSRAALAPAASASIEAMNDIFR
jgi:hypothetical protein